MLEMETLVKLAAAMNREGVEYVVFGGAAVNLHGVMRQTEDLDIFVRPDAANVAALKRTLRSVWNDPNIDDIRDDDMMGDYPSVRYYPMGGEFFIDFVSRLGEAFAYDDLDVEVHDVDGVPIRIVTPATLYRMKRHTVRPKDWGDAAALRDKFHLPEE